MTETATAVAPAPPADDAAFVGRQCIFDRRLAVFAYELLYRSGDVPVAGVVDGNAATADVMLSGFLDIGLQRLVGGYPAFINFPRDLLLYGATLPVGPERVVIEILEDVEIDDALIAALGDLHEAGYALALDDFEWSPRWEPVLRLCDYVKVDVMATGLDGAVALAERLAPFSAKLLAEKVESRAEFEALREAGYDYFQGFFFQKPEVVRGKRLASSRMSTMRLLAALHDPEADTGRIEALVSRDAPLSYKLLRYLNSAFYALPQEITSVRRAVVYIGLDALKRLATLIALARTEDKPSELVRVALVRARMCELLAERAGADDPGAYFTVGLLSMLDALMDAPLDELLDALSLSAAVDAALRRGDGDMGAALACIAAYERCEWERVRFAGLDEATLGAAYADAVEWARDAWATMAAE